MPTKTPKKVKEKGKYTGFYVPPSVKVEFKKMMADLGASESAGVSSLMNLALYDPATHEKLAVEVKKA